MKWYFIMALVLVVFISGCTKTIIVPGEPTDKIVGKATEVVQVTEEEQDEEKGEPLETKTTLRQVKCGDNFCANREHLSDTKRMTCGADLSFCNIDIDGRMTATENFYTCPEDCTDECAIAFSVSVCDLGRERFKIKVSGNKLYNYSMLFEGAELSVLTYGRWIGKEFTWNVAPYIAVAGSINQVHFMPKIVKNGKVIDCSNEEVVVDDIRKC